MMTQAMHFERKDQLMTFCTAPEESFVPTPAKITQKHHPNLTSHHHHYFCVCLVFACIAFALSRVLSMVWVCLDSCAVVLCGCWLLHSRLCFWFASFACKLSLFILLTLVAFVCFCCVHCLCLVGVCVLLLGANHLPKLPKVTPQGVRKQPHEITSSRVGEQTMDMKVQIPPRKDGKLCKFGPTLGFECGEK